MSCCAPHCGDMSGLTKKIRIARANVGYEWMFKPTRKMRRSSKTQKTSEGDGCSSTSWVSNACTQKYLFGNSNATMACNNSIRTTLLTRKNSNGSCTSQMRIYCKASGDIPAL